MASTTSLSEPEVIGVAEPAAGHGGQGKAALWHGAGAILALLVVWWALTDGTGALAPTVLPSPVEVVQRFAEMLTDPFSGLTLQGHVLMSLQRWGLGLLFAVLIGIPLGVVLAWVPLLRAAVTPLFEILRYIPPFAWIPVAVLALGASLEAQAMIVFVAAFPVCVINTQTGVAMVDPILERAARNLGSGQVRTLFRVVLPDSLPMIFTGMRTATSNGWMALVGAELVVGKEGLGFLIAQGQVIDSPVTIVVGMISIGLVGTLVDILMQRTQTLITPWQPRPERTSR